MKKRMVKLLSLALSGMLTLSSLGSMTVFAAPEEDFGDRLEEQFEAENEVIEDDAEVEETSLDVEEENIDNVEITTEELVPPVDVKWEAPGIFSFKIASDKPMFYGYEVWRNDHHSLTGFMRDLSNRYGETITEHCEGCFQSSGTYTVKVYVAINDSKDAERIYATEKSIYWSYPDNKLPTPKNPRWERESDERFAVAICDPVEHAYAYDFMFIIDGKGGNWILSTSPHAKFSNWIGDNTEHEYSFAVQAHSNDLTKYENSNMSERSSILVLDGNTIQTQKDIIDLGKDVTPSNIDETVEGVKKIDNTILKTALQTDNDAVEAMAKIEGKYTEAKGIKIMQATSEVSKIPANEVEMTGAALNVSEGTVQLNVKDPKTEGSAIINTDIYTNIIAFDMSVTSSEGIDFSKELEVPVTISMPIPEGMDASRLVILHYRADLTEELITPRIENGKAIFAITHFSTFALAEKKDSSNVIDVPDGPAPRIIVNTDGTSTVYQNGVEIQNYTGLAMLGTEDVAPWVYVENNKRNETFSGFADYDGETFYVAGGTMATDLNGLQVDPKNGKDWYFLAGGQVQKHHEGLALYNNEWFYIKEGRLDTNLNAYVDYNGGKFFVGAGRIIQEYNGLAQDPQNTVDGDWYFLANGQAQTQYTGLAFYDNAWFYVINGKLATDYTGNVEYDGSTFYVENGMVM
ncbi:MAG: hypothetical protein J6N53_09865 [Lachnospiraceae bacterium]|nr:hypothetical protein [Lachnospiraceae bacterium]